MALLMNVCSNSKLDNMKLHGNPDEAFKMPFGGMIAYYFGILIIVMTILELVKTLW